MDWLLPVRAVPGGAQSNGAQSFGAQSFEVVPHSEMLGTYGSFLMACAVRAAWATTDGMTMTSLRADFLSRPGPGPIRFDVEESRTGRTVAVRRVVVAQARTHAVLTVSFAAPAPGAPGWDGSASPPGEGPESLARLEESQAGLQLLDLRPVDGGGGRGGFRRLHPFWARPDRPFGEGAEAAAAAVTLATDHFVTALATPPEAGDPGFAVTLDHSLWLHRRCQADEWLRYDGALLAAGEGRSVIRGTVTDRAGRLVASFTQQALRRELP